MYAERWIGFLNDLLCGRSYIAALAELSIPFLLDEKSTLVPVRLAGERSGDKRGRGVKALIDAARENDMKGILEILGSDAKSILESGDPVADNEGRERFVKSYDEANKLVKSGEAQMVLEVGKDEWPFLIPLVKESNGWRFDTKEGKEEIINRRIGRNELDVIPGLSGYRGRGTRVLSARPRR